MGHSRKISKEWAMRIIKLASGFVGAFLLIFFLTLETLAAEGVVKATSANIRANADAGSKIVASVLQGDKLTIKEQVTGADGKIWYKVFIDSQNMGYVRSDLIDKTGDVPTGTTDPVIQPEQPASNSNDSNATVITDGSEKIQPISGSVTKDQVRVRADSTTTSGIVATIKKDVVFTVNATKTNNAGETWYLVEYLVNDKSVTGYIRSDFVTLSGEIVPYSDVPQDTEPEEPQDTEPEEPEPVVPNDYETKSEEGVWYLYDNIGSLKYRISDLITTAQQNATDLSNAQKKMGKQNGIIGVLTAFLVILVIIITAIIFKFKDVMDNEGLELSDLFPHKNRVSSQRKPLPRAPGSRPSTGNGHRPTQRPAGTRPEGTRPAQAVTHTVSPRPEGSRPAGVRPEGSRPTGVRPEGSRPAGVRPEGSRPAGVRPEGSRSVGVRPEGTRPTEGVRPESGSIERQAKAHVEVRNLQQANQQSQGWKPKNFVSDDDEFEFEFLNWDGEEEHKDN